QQQAGAQGSPFDRQQQYVWAYDGSGSDRDSGRLVPIGGAGRLGMGASSPALQAPNPEDFYSGGDQWTQTVELSPEMQALWDQQNRLQQGMFGAQDSALGRVNVMMGQGFDLSSLPDRAQITAQALDP